MRIKGHSPECSCAVCAKSKQHSVKMRPELCRLCERPAAEGGYRGAELDLEALAEWCLNYLGSTLADEVKDEDLFCFFCVWDARFLRETLNGPESELIPCWWPDEKTKDTKTFSYDLFKAGNIQQCWVTLQKLPSDESSLQNYEREPKEYDLDKTKFQCIYCIKSFACKLNLKMHIKRMHGTIAIRCNFNVRCCSFFLTVVERDLHIKEFHLKPKVPVFQNCIYCQRNGFTRKAIWQHVKNKHADVAFMCPYLCAKYFKSENELKIHSETQHKGIEERKKFKCSMCSYQSRRRDLLMSHEVKVHQKLVPLLFKCLQCPATFISNLILKRHISDLHQYRDCPSCKMRITFGSFSQHFQIVPCRFCKIKFNCRGLLRDHNLKCGLSFSCAFCLKVFEYKSSLQYHLIRNHLQVKDLRFKDRGHKCNICSNYLSSSETLKKHILQMHYRKHAVQCFHCDKVFARKENLIFHLAEEHDRIETNFKCQLCPRKFFRPWRLKCHQQKEHIGKAKCFICNKYVRPNCLPEHLKLIHNEKLSKFNCTQSKTK